jgi:hypothetical protein
MAEARRAGAVESEPDAVERSPVIRRLAAKVSFRLAPALVVDASALRGFVASVCWGGSWEWEWRDA